MFRPQIDSPAASVFYAARKAMSRTAPILLAAALIAAPAVAMGQAAPQPGQLSASSPIELLETRAADGDLAAMFYLGAKYSEGRGVPKDEAEGLRWYLKVAERGNSGAMLNVGNSYYNGRGTTVDRAAAAYWFRKAAEKGNASAMYNLAICHASGQGVDKDEDEAVKWFRAAAAKGNERAMAALSSRGLTL